jgi:hypothetical protein
MIESESELQFTYSDRREVRPHDRWLLVLVLGFVISITILGCGQKQTERSEKPNPSNKSWNRSAAEMEYRLIQTELSLVKTGQPYLVLDLKHEKLVLKLKGAVVWSYPMNFAAADSQQVRGFLQRFQGRDRKLVRPLAGKHLFAAKEKTPDSVLAVVGEVVKVDPELLRRELPERFQLRWGGDLILEVRTDISGKSISIFRNAIVEMRQMLQRPFGEAAIVLKMESEAALTLYRATTDGMPTLIYAPS